MSRITNGERWYRRLLQLYPREFREDFGREMTQLYRDRGRDESAWRLWSSLIVDLIRTAPSEHLSILRHDLKHAWRGFARTPIVSTTAVLTLALGVGASTAVFSVVHAVLLRPLPYPEEHRLVELFEEDLTAGGRTRASALNYLSWSERSASFDAVGAFRNTGVTLMDGDPELLGGSVMTASVFRVLRLPPITGRPLEPGDEQVGSPRVAVLNESLWRRRFGGDREIVGRSITLDGERYQVVGVMPRSFREIGRSQVGATADAQIFLPMQIDPAQENRGNHTLRVIGRLRDAVTIDQARHEMRVVAAGMQQDFPASNTNWSVWIDTVSNTMLDLQIRRSLLLVLGAVAMVFLIACANVANLLLAHGTRREAELAIRTALGARGSRLMRQLLTESGCLAMVGGLAGVFIAAIAHPVVRALVPPGVARADEMTIDFNVLVFGVVTSIVSGLVFGVVPAFRVSRFDVARSLSSVGRTTMDASRVRLRQTLIVGQMALATMLLVVAALLLQGFVRLQRVPLGFQPDNVGTTRISLPRNDYSDPVRTAEFYRRLIASIRGVGEVADVAVGTSAPFAPGIRVTLPLSGKDAAAEHIVSGRYFDLLRIPLLAGRSFNEHDTMGSSSVAVVSQRLARISWPNANPLGQTIARSGRSYEVVGVVGDVRGSDIAGARGGGPDREPRAAIYFAAEQLPQRGMTVLVRSKLDGVNLATTIRESVRQQDPSLPIQQVRMLPEWFAESVESTRVTTTLALMFAICALGLTSIGIYGVLAYVVASRTREIGVRMALGATRHRIIGLVLRDGMAWAGSGIALGLIGALAVERFLTILLFEVPPHDPVTFTGVAAALAAVALLACAIPASRAVRIDPTVAMRAE